jgi:hypothetical protein
LSIRIKSEITVSNVTGKLIFMLKTLQSRRLGITLDPLAKITMLSRPLANFKKGKRMVKGMEGRQKEGREKAGDEKRKRIGREERKLTVEDEEGRDGKSGI